VTLLGKVLPLTLAGDVSEPPLSVLVTYYHSPDHPRRDE
jgi:hypothetical protein